MILRKDIPADGLPGLLCAELLEQVKYVRSNIDRPGFAVFGVGKVYPVRWGVLNIAADGDCFVSPVNICPFQAASFTPPDPCICNQRNIGLPFQRLPLQALENMTQLLDGIGFLPFVLCLFVLAWGGTLHLQHGIGFDGIIQKSHLKNAIQNIVELDR